MARFLILLLAFLAMGTFAKSQTQSDTSDAVWSIVIPLSESRDIDMRECLVGVSKDSVIVEFIRNSGSWRFRVDSVYIQGADAGAFALVSGFPVYSIEPGMAKFAEFRFTPNRAGLHQAEIVIVTQAETLYQKITGEGIQPQLEVYSGIIDFGEVEIGNDKIIQDTVLLKNISASPIAISNTIKMSPDIEQFEILEGGGGFVLQPHSDRKLTLQFKPKYGGRTSGRIGFEYNGVGSPAIVHLFGAGIGGLVFIPSDSGYAGDKLHISLILDKVKPEGIQALASKFSVILKFQGTILAPQDYSKISGYSNDTISVYLEGPISNSNTLITLPVTAGLGNIEQTDIQISDFKLYDHAGKQIEYDVDYRYGSFTLLGICEEGGNRLVNPSKITKLMTIAPNPSDGNVNIELNLVEKGATFFKIFDSNGQLIEQKEFSSVGNFKIEFDAKQYANGLYFIHLQTPTVIRNEKFIILR